MQITFKTDDNANILLLSDYIAKDFSRLEKRVMGAHTVTFGIAYDDKYSQIFQVNNKDLTITIRVKNFITHRERLRNTIEKYEQDLHWITYPPLRKSEVEIIIDPNEAPGSLECL